MARVRRKWTAEEDALLRSAVKTAQAESRPLLWRKLAKCVPARTNKDCRRRWWNSLANGTAKGSWSEEEDERLIAAVRRYGTNWIRVSCEVGSRSPDQCSSHWSQVLDPNINYCDWTAEEDANLLHAVLTYGTNWATIAFSHRPSRTTLALRNRYSTLRLQNNNDKNKANADTTEKAHKDLPAISETAMATSTKEVDWSMEAPRCSSWIEGDRVAQSSDEEDGDEDDGDEDEDEDNEDGENEDEGLHQTSHTSRMEVMPNSQGANHDTGARSIQIPDSNLTSWDTWAARSIVSANSMDDKAQPISTDNSAIDRANHMQYQTLLGLNSPSQYPTPGESYFYNVPEPGVMNTSLPKSIYDTSPIDINLTTSLSTFHTPSQPATAPPTLSNMTGAEASPAQASSADMAASKSTSISAGTSPSTSPSTQSLDFQSTIMYQVSISMACTRAQLDANMVLLVGMGTSVTIQIDKKS